MTIFDIYENVNQIHNLTEGQTYMCGLRLLENVMMLACKRQSAAYTVKPVLCDLPREHCIM
jgi:hypothetical protein